MVSGIILDAVVLALVLLMCADLLIYLLMDARALTFWSFASVWSATYLTAVSFNPYLLLSLLMFAAAVILFAVLTYVFVDRPRIAATLGQS